MLYGVGRDGVIPRAFAKVHPKYKTPYVGTLVIGVLSCFEPLVLSISQLVRLVNFGALSSFILLNVAVFVFFFIKEKRRNSVGDILKFLISPICEVAILVFIFTGIHTCLIAAMFTDSTVCFSPVFWIILGLGMGAIDHFKLEDKNN